MKAPKPPSKALRRLAHAIRIPRPALSSEALADLWVSKNYDALAEIGLRSLRDAPGTSYNVHPLSFVVFPTEEAQRAYKFCLLNEARMRKAKRLADESLCLHVTALTDWCKGEMVRALGKLTVHGTFKGIA
jgi:hypothetical protein